MRAYRLKWQHQAFRPTATALLVILYFEVYFLLDNHPQAAPIEDEQDYRLIELYQ